MNIKKIIIFLVFLNINFSHSYSMAPDVFVQSTVNRASQILSKNISKEEKINELKSIARETVDIEVLFYPQFAGLNHSNIFILSNDPDNPVYEINVQAFCMACQ